MRKLLDTTAVKERLQAVYPGLSPRLRRAARYVLKEPAFVALYPLRRVASRATVSPATLVRLAAEVGFKSYNELRDVLRDGLHAGSARYATDARFLRSFRHEGEFEKVYRATGDAQARNIGDLFAAIPTTAVEAAGRALTRARSIYVLGLRSNYAAAFYFHYMLRTFRSNAVLLEGRLGMLVDELGSIGPRDVLIAISYEPYATETVRAVEYAVAAGAKIVALTDQGVSPIARGAAHLFIVPTSGTAFYQSLVPTMALLESLVCFVVARDGGAGARVKAEFERRERFGVYWRDQARRSRARRPRGIR